MKAKAITIIISVFYFLLVRSQVDSIQLFQPTLSYTTEAGRNFSGGIKTGNAFNGLLLAGFTLNSSRWWQGGELSLEAMNTHGSGFSEKLTGDAQILSNIENGNEVFLFQAFVKQQIGNLSIIVGLHDMNSEFVSSNYGGSLCNSSFGIMSPFALNQPTPIFARNGLGIVFRYQYSEQFTFLAATYDGNPGNFDEDPYNLKFSIKQKDGVFSIAEIQFHPAENQGQSIKVGMYGNPADFTDQNDDSKVNGIYGFYCLGDLPIAQQHSENNGLFWQATVSPSPASFNPIYLGAGCNLGRLIPARPKDITSLGMASAWDYNGNIEFVIECNHCFVLHDQISITPDFQYIRNPGFSEVKSAFTGFIRLNIGL